MSFTQNIVHPRDIENIIFPQFCQYCDTKLKQKEIYICCDCISNVSHTEMGDWRDIVTSSEHIDFAISAFWYDDYSHKNPNHLLHN